MKLFFKRKIGTILSLICAIFLLGSCSALLKKVVKDPKIKIERVDVKDATLVGANLIFVLEVMNPNDYEIKVDQVQYKVFLGDRYFAEAQSHQQITVAASASTQVELPLPIVYSQLMQGMVGLLSGKSLSYRVEGTVKLNFLGLSIPFDETGKVSL